MLKPNPAAAVRRDVVPDDAPVEATQGIVVERDAAAAFIDDIVRDGAIFDPRVGGFAGNQEAAAAKGPIARYQTIGTVHGRATTMPPPREPYSPLHTVKPANVLLVP